MTNKVTLQSGDKAPNFNLTNQSGEQVSLADFQGKNLIVYVYPKALTPGCTTQACDFQENLSLLNNSGVAVVGLSGDTPKELENFANKEKLTFPLLSDPDHKVIKQFGAWGEKNNYGKISEGIIRSSFLIDDKGTIVHALYNVKATGHVAKIIQDWKLG